MSLHLRSKEEEDELYYDYIQMDSGLSKLYLAAWLADFDTVRTIIQSGADVNSREATNNSTPIYGAILSKDVRMVQELIDAGADVNVACAAAGATPLYLAISKKEVEIVQNLLDNGADFLVKIFKDNTALHFCAELGNAKICELLIERGLDVNARNHDDKTPLHFAVKAGNAKIVRLLMTRGADVSVTCIEPVDEHGKENLWSNVTSVHLAALCGHTDIVNMLIKEGADVTVKTSTNCTALHLAAQCGHVKIVEMLLAAGAGHNINVQSDHILGHTPLLLATKGGEMDVIKMLLEVEGIEVNPFEAPILPLVLAAGKGRLDVMELLVANGALVNHCTVTGMTPLHCALMFNKDEAAEFLIRHGADINATFNDNDTPLHVACEKNGSIGIVCTLVEKGANVNGRKDDASTPFLQAAQHNSVETLKFLVDSGADPKATNKTNWTALHYASINGKVETVAYLVKIGLEIDAMTHSRSTPLHFAVKEGHLEVVIILLKNGANVNAQDDTNRTPLHIALKKGHLEIAEQLLKRCVLINSRERKEGSTPLFLAVESELEKLVHQLLDRGVDVNVANKFGILPIHAAAKAENVDVVKALLTKGAYYDKEVQTDSYSGAPLDFAQEAENDELIAVLKLIQKLFNAVIKNEIVEIERCIQAGAIVNARKANRRTAMHYAVSNNNTAAVEVLLKGGADITLTTNKIDLPLQIAIANDCHSISKILLAHAKNLSPVKYNVVINAKTTKGGGTMLHNAVESNKIQLVKYLLKNGAAYNIKNDSGKMPIELMTVDGAIKSLFKAVEKLFEAVKEENGLEEVKQILKNNNSVVNARDADFGGTPLYWSVLKGHIRIANALLLNGADYRLVNNDGTSLLHVAASKGNIEIMKVLLNCVKNDNTEEVNDFINTTTVNGMAALHAASNIEIVKCLLQAGATYDTRDNEDKTTLELTQNDEIKKFLETTRQLFEDVEKGVSTVMDTLNSLGTEEYKAVVGARNAQGQTLVQVALTNARLKIAKLLVQRLKKLS